MPRRRRTQQSGQLSLDFDDEETENDLTRCVEAIREDLRLGTEGRNVSDYFDMLHLCEIHGGAPIPTDGKTACDDHDILLCSSTPNEEAGPVLAHELVHRLCRSPRWEYLNPVTVTCSQERFEEMLATEVSER